MPPMSDIRDAIEKVIDAFEEEWLGGNRPRIEDYVTGSGAARRDLLVELALTDLEYRLRANEERVVEDLGQRFPELKRDADAWRGLILEEYRLRRRMGQTPSWDDYRKRFPEQASRLDSKAAEDAHTLEANLTTRAPLSAVKLPSLSKRYRAQRIIAEGGMAYIARIVDNEFDRPLAMKILANKFKGDRELEERFMREARLSGQLQHPGIPPVQEKGRLDDGTPYFIMKLIKGHSLQKLLRDRANPHDQLGHFVGVFASICQTMAYAHSRGIIHRDLKPGNIMVGAFGEVQVMDWGLAKILRPGVSSPDSAVSAKDYSSTVHIINTPTTIGQHTIAGAVMGTPGYMAPEQARGETDKLDQRCDVFGLGGILCDILTGHPPFMARDGASSQRLNIMGDVTETYSRLDNSGADADLVALAKRCVAPEIEDRPADARAVADAVAAYQLQVQERLKQAELEQARLVTKAEEEKIRRRDRRVLGSCIAALLVVGVFAWQWYQKRATEAAASLSQTASIQAMRQVDNAISLVEYGQAKMKDGTLEETRTALLDTRKALEQAQRVADDARVNKDKTPLTSSDARLVAERFDGYDTLFKNTSKSAVLAENLMKGLEGRDELKERDLDVRGKANIRFGKAGPKIYRDAFADFGIIIDKTDTASAAKKLVGFPLHQLLGMALTDWVLCERGQPDLETIADLARAVDPNPIRARLRANILSGKAGDLIEMSRSLAPEAQEPTLVILLADALLGVDAAGEAIDLLSRAIEEFPSEFWINAMLGQCLAIHAPDRSTEAIDRLESAYVLRPKSAFATVNLAEALAANRRFSQAEKTCRRFLEACRRLPEKKEQSNPRVCAALAAALMQELRLVEAEDALRDGLAIHPDSGFLKASQASLRDRQGKHPEARNLASASLGQYPHFADAYAPLGYAHLHLKETDNALKAGRLLIDWNPRGSAGFDLASRALLQRNQDLAKAEEYANKAVALDAKNPAVHKTLGDVLFAKREYKRGYPSIKSAAELSIGPIPEFRESASALAQQNLYPESQWLYTEIVKRDVNDDMAWKNLMTILYVTRDTNEVREHLGPSLGQLSKAQTAELNSIVPADSRPINTTDLNRPINHQQPPIMPGSRKNR